jgi:hypothetical protein
MLASSNSLTVPAHGRDRDVPVDLGGAPIQLFDVGVILRVRQHPGDDPALLGHLEAFFDTEPLKPRWFVAAHRGKAQAFKKLAGR